MDCRDIASPSHAVIRFAARLLLLAAGFVLLWAGPVLCAEAPPLRGRPEIRWEPIAVLSQWGPPLLRADLGKIRVPENRSSGSTREIELAFVLLHATGTRPGPPIVWLSGGPGDSGTADLGTPLLQLFLELRTLGDVIVLDQRGTGSSIPRLDCPGSLQFPRDVPVDRAMALRTLEASARICADRWRSAGVDLSSFNTRESGEDVEDLRLALGSTKLRLLAGSYGTHLALAAIRAHPESFDRAALVGVVGPDHLRRSPADSEKQLALIARLAAAGPSSASRIPDLVALIRRVRDRLAERPARVEIETPAGERRAVVVSPFDLEWYTRSLLTTRNAIAHVPAFFLAMEEGDFTELARVADGWRTASAPAATIFAQRCGSGASAERELRIVRERSSAALGDATDFAEANVCRAWGIVPLPESFREPVRSTLPVLFVSGTLDGDTPESNAAEVSPGFPNGAQLRVEGAAHALLGCDDASTRESIVRFLGGGKVGKTRISLAALPFEHREPGRAGALIARGAMAAPSLFGMAH